MSDERQPRRENYGYCIFPALRRALRKTGMDRHEVAKYLGISGWSNWKAFTSRAPTLSLVRLSMCRSGAYSRAERISCVLTPAAFCGIVASIKEELCDGTFWTLCAGSAVLPAL